MNLRTFVIASNIKNLTDARYCAGMGVPYIGFNLDKNGMDDNSFVAITEWISGCEIIGEFHSSSFEEIKSKVDQLELKHVLVSNPNIIAPLKELGLEVLFQSRDSSIPDSTPDFYLSDDNSAAGGKDKFILSGDIDVNDLEGIIKNDSIYGIAIEGGDEERPGFKDMDALADLLEALEEEY